jgi:putative transposase
MIIMKPGTYTQMYVQLVFAVKFKDSVLHERIRKRVFEYMSGILTQQKHKSIIINGVSDHIHIFYGMNPAISVSDTVHDLKRNCSLLINNEKLCLGKFAWQEGYGGFTYSRSQINEVYKYIEKQEIHHKKKTFREEYIEFLVKFEIEYDQRFLFEFFDVDV